MAGGKQKRNNTQGESKVNMANIDPFPKCTVEEGFPAQWLVLSVTCSFGLGSDLPGWPFRPLPEKRPGPNISGPKRVTSVLLPGSCPGGQLQPEPRGLRVAPEPGSRAGAVLCRMGTNASCWAVPLVSHCSVSERGGPVLLEHLQHALGLFPPRNLVEKGLEAAVAGTFSKRGLWWGPSLRQGPWPSWPCLPHVSPSRCLFFSPSHVWLPLCLCSLSWLQSHAVLMRAWPPVWGGSAAVHLINNLTLQFFRVNAAILFFTNWKRLVKLRDEWPFLLGMC